VYCYFLPGWCVQNMCVLKDPQPYDRLISYVEGREPLNGKTSIQKIGIKAGASPRPYHTSYVRE
jgi:hypothetical protein